MALELKISINSFDRETDTVTINDDTGVYNAGTNPGGYGTPNPERNTLALVISTKRIGSQMEVVKWNDPINDSSFDYKFDSDGVYDIYLCALPFITGSFDPNTLIDGYVFYSVLDDKVYKVVEGSDGNNRVEETNDVVSNSLHLSDPLKYKVQSMSEKRLIDIWCGWIGGCVDSIPEIYVDLEKGIRAAECYFEEGYYLQSDNTFKFLYKIG